MPNWTTNYLDVLGDKEKVNAFSDLVYSENTHDDSADLPYSFDFFATVPCPKEYEDTQCGGQLSDEQQELQAELTKKYGHPDWYSWNCANIGTKWNACDAHEVEQIDGGLRFSFNTAWSPPLPWLEKTAYKYPDLKFDLYFQNEGGGMEQQGKVSVWHETDDELRVEEETWTEHEWYYKFEPAYQEEYDFITEGDYDDVIKEYSEDCSEFNWSSLEIALANRVKDKDLPLFINYFETHEANSIIASRLKGK